MSKKVLGEIGIALLVVGLLMGVGTAIKLNPSVPPSVEHNGPYSSEVIVVEEDTGTPTHWGVCTFRLLRI